MNFDEYLELDARNARAVLRLLRDADSNFSVTRGPERSLSDLLEDGFSMFDALQRAYGQGAGTGDESDHRGLGVVSKRLSLPDDEFQRVIRDRSATVSHGHPSDLIGTARELADSIASRYVRGILLASISRCFVFAVTDLLRLRVTPSIGQQRLAVEAIALIELMRRTPSVAMEWMELPVVDARFYGAHQRELKAIMSEMGLSLAYDRSSSVSQHVRLVGLAGGLDFARAQHGSRVTHQIKLDYQEIPDDDDKTRRLLLCVLDLLAFFGVVFEAITRGLPEVKGVFLEARIPQFRQHVYLNREKFRNTWPEWAAKAQERFGSLGLLNRDMRDRGR